MFYNEANLKNIQSAEQVISMFLTSFPIISFSLSPVFCLVPGTEA